MCQAALYAQKGVLQELEDMQNFFAQKMLLCRRLAGDAVTAESLNTFKDRWHVTRRASHNPSFEECVASMPRQKKYPYPQNVLLGWDLKTDFLEVSFWEF